jgi:tetratricopeptide (TPR) repeat protein
MHSPQLASATTAPPEHSCSVRARYRTQLDGTAGDHAAAAGNHQRALDLHGQLGLRIGEAETLNSLGELSTRTSATGQARGYHIQALAPARDIGVPVEEARALEGIGRSHLRDGNPRQAAAHLQQALMIYQRIGVAAAQSVQETLRQTGSSHPRLNPPAVSQTATA